MYPTYYSKIKGLDPLIGGRKEGHVVVTCSVVMYIVVKV